MKGELKAGGLALAYGFLSDQGKKWNGQSVTVLERRDDMPDEYSAVWWRCETRHGVVHFATKNLMPIDGDDHQEPDQLAKDKPAELTA